MMLINSRDASDAKYIRERNIQRYHFEIACARKVFHVFSTFPVYDELVGSARGVSRCARGGGEQEEA